MSAFNQRAVTNVSSRRSSWPSARLSLRGLFLAPRVPDVGRKLLGVFMRCANVFRVRETGQNPYQGIGGGRRVVVVVGGDPQH